MPTRDVCLRAVGSVTEGGPSRALEGLEGEGGGSARLVALEGDNQGRRLWRMLASRGIVEVRNAQMRPFSLFSAFLCDCRPPHCRPRWIPIQTTYPTLYQYALNTLSCPATSTECERVFSNNREVDTRD